MKIDFSDPSRARTLQAAHKLVSDAYRLLASLGVRNPADNQFLREATVCAELGLIWSPDRGGADAHTSSGEEVEIKSTRLDDRRVQFPTSRDISETVINRWRRADFWLFAVFDSFENLVALYRVDREDWAPVLDRLEERMHEKHAEGRRLNNPHIPLGMFRDDAQLILLHPNYQEIREANGTCMIRPIAGGPDRPDVAA